MAEIFPALNMDVGSFTNEQRARYDAFREKWRSFSLDGDTSLDVEAGKKGADYLYVNTNYGAPALAVVVGSPLGAQVVANILAPVSGTDAGFLKWAKGSEGKRWASIGDEHYREVEFSTYGYESVALHALIALGEGMRRLYRQHNLKLPKSMSRDKFEELVKDWSTRLNSRDTSGFNSFPMGDGLGWDCTWLSHYEYAIEAGHQEWTGPLREYFAFCRGGVWDAIWMEQAAIMVRRVKRVHFDNEDRLHHPSHECALWADGWKQYYFNGVRVDGNWFVYANRPSPKEGKMLNVRDVMKEQNIELRRILINLIGYERFIAETKAKRLHEDVDSSGQPRTLWRIPQSGDEDVVLLEVKCPSTGKVAHLRVPPSSTNCADACAWTFDQSVSTYAPLIEA